MAVNHHYWGFLGGRKQIVFLIFYPNIVNSLIYKSDTFVGKKIFATLAEIQLR